MSASTVTVALQTNCWERDWERVLETDQLDYLATSHDVPFASKTLLINRLEHYGRASRLADRAIERGWLTDYVIVEEDADAALEFFELSRKILARGFNYSIAQLVGLHLCSSEFLLYYMGDCLPEKRSPWVSKALTLFENDARVKVANLTWDGKYEEAQSESSSETEDFYFGMGFSDQCYLVRTEDLRQPIYGHTHAKSARYPLYAGESFEKRIDSWMQCHGHLRATYKHAAYLHRNVPPPAAQRLKSALTRVARAAIPPRSSGES